MTVKDHVKNTLNLTVATHDIVSEMRLNLQKKTVPKKIHLHKQTGEMIYTDLLKSTLKVSKLQSTVSKLENQLKQEKIEKKAYQQQIKKLQGDLLAMDSNQTEDKLQRKSWLRKKTLSNY